jgi:hypothetical protein
MNCFAMMLSMQEWYVIFRSYEGRSKILSKLLKSGFGHVMIVKKTGNILVVIDPLTSGIDVNTVRPVTTDTIFACLSPDMTVLKVTLPAQHKLVITHFANYLPSCVTCAKVLLGVRSWSLTPYGLYKYLQKLGATSIKKSIGNSLTHLLEIVLKSKRLMMRCGRKLLIWKDNNQSTTEPP